MKKSLSFLLILLPQYAFAVGKLDFMAGFFSINAKTSQESTSISNPSAFRVGYAYPATKRVDLFMGYSVLLADFSGSDMGYGLDLGANYFFMSDSQNEIFKNDHIEVNRYELYRPYVGLGFYQRQFQSVKNGYAGLGANAGVERYHSKTTSFKIEARYIQLSGAAESEATELNLLIGITYRI